MTTRYADYCSFAKLPCAWGEAKIVVLCLQDAALVAQPTAFCNGDSATILATICQVYKTADSCQNPLWHYTFSYESEALANPDTPLASSDITGVFCLDCFTEWIIEQTGNEVTLVDNGDGTLTLTTQHGCTYTFNGSFPD